MIDRVEVAADLEPLEAVQTGDVQRLLFGPAQRRQQEGRKDGNDCDDHQQFDQREGAWQQITEVLVRAIRLQKLSSFTLLSGLDKKPSCPMKPPSSGIP